MKRLLVNALMCLKCGEVAESLFTQPDKVVSCSCGSVKLSGGLDKIVYSGVPGAAYSLAVYNNMPYSQQRNYRYIMDGTGKIPVAELDSDVVQALLDMDSVKGSKIWVQLLEEKLYRQEL